MKGNLLSTAGVDALRRLAAGRSVLAFDLDGTLAPLVPRPADAKVAPSTAAHLRALCQLWPVAVISGRAVDDTGARLGFTPHFLFGNHGAEVARGKPALHLKRALDPCRELLALQAASLQAHGIDVEDKTLSMSLHYARAPDAAASQAWLDRLLKPLCGCLRAEHGHLVLSVSAGAPPDKGDALLAVLRDCGADAALVVGDDDNDEAAFAKCPADSVSVRIGPRQTPTRARFRMTSQSQMALLLCLLRRLRH